MVQSEDRNQMAKPADTGETRRSGHPKPIVFIDNQVFFNENDSKTCFLWSVVREVPNLWYFSNINLTFYLGSECE